MDTEARAVLEKMKTEIEDKFASWENRMGVFEGRIAQAHEVYNSGLSQAISSSQDILDIKVEMATRLAEAATAVKMLQQEIEGPKLTQAQLTTQIGDGFTQRDKEIQKLMAGTEGV